MPDPVVPFDLVRMFLGTDPPLFYLEIAARILIVYAYAMVLIRWVGGRGIAQMSIVEFLLVIALGSAVGDAMFYPEVPILHALLVITGVVLFNKGLDFVVSRSARAERFVDGVAVEVVRDGVIEIANMRSAKLSRSELFAALRRAGFTSLGQVERGYLEATGYFSFFPLKRPRPGLPVYPAWATEPPQILRAGAPLDAGARAACETCAWVLEADLPATPRACPVCGHDGWALARCDDRPDPAA